MAVTLANSGNRGRRVSAGRLKTSCRAGFQRGKGDQVRYVRRGTRPAKGSSRLCPVAILKNQKREAFAQVVALNECSGAKSYRRHISGGKCSDRTAEVAASELLRRDSEVVLRVAELRAASAAVAERDFDLTRSAWLARLLALADKAEDAGDYSAALLPF